MAGSPPKQRYMTADNSRICSALFIELPPPYYAGILSSRAVSLSKSAWREKGKEDRKRERGEGGYMALGLAGPRSGKWSVVVKSWRLGLMALHGKHDISFDFSTSCSC